MSKPVVDPKFVEHEHAGWQARATGYDAHLGRITTEIAGPLLDAASVTAGSRVLDVACGPGYAAGQAVARGAIARGIDFSASMVAEARARFPDADFADGDAHALGSLDGEPFVDAAESERTLAAAGFREVHLQEVAPVWRAASADAFVDMMEKSTVRAAMMVESQVPEVRERIKAAMRQGAEEFRVEGWVRDPLERGHRLCCQTLLTVWIQPASGLVALGIGLGLGELALEESG